MNINFITSIGKYFTHQPPSIGRVASTARLAGVKGSELQRTQLASELNDKIFKVIGDTFSRKAELGEKLVLSKKELASCIKQAVPDIKIVIKNEKDPRYFASLAKICNRKDNKVVGFILSLTEDVEKGKNEAVLRHEMRHFCDYITQPKLLARSNKDAIIAKLGKGSKERSAMHWDFYADTLYRPKIHPDSKTEISELTKYINWHFKSLRTASEEKIEIMQKWRSGLKTELNAYADEANFVCKENPDKSLNEFFFFGPKIKLIEQMLKEEISAVRKESALKSGSKAPN